jgi:hypothetical protein
MYKITVNYKNGDILMVDGYYDVVEGMLKIYDEMTTMTFIPIDNILDFSIDDIIAPEE